MVCFHPKTAWQCPTGDLYEPSQVYYQKKKLSFKEVKGWNKIEIPCGHCIGCKLDSASMWGTRCTLEAKNWKNNCFITLTYNNEHLPKNKNNKPTLVKKHIQDFLKRLRYYEKGIETWDLTKESNPIRYFACGEYGPKGGRPHYHLAIFNWIPDDLKFYKFNKYNQPIWKSKKLMKYWGQGFITVEELNYNTANYVAQYTLKKAGLKPNKREYTGEYEIIKKIDERNGNIFEVAHNIQRKIKHDVEDEFTTMSRAIGIGRIYWDKNKEKIKNNGNILLKIDGVVKAKPIPRYFKKLWENENWEEYVKFKYEKQKEGLKLRMDIISRIKYVDVQEEVEEIKYSIYLEQQEKILLGKRKNYQRNSYEI